MRAEDAEPPVPLRHRVVVEGGLPPLPANEVNALAPFGSSGHVAQRGDGGRPKGVLGEALRFEVNGVYLKFYLKIMCLCTSELISGQVPGSGS